MCGTACVMKFPACSLERYPPVCKVIYFLCQEAGQPGLVLSMLPVKILSSWEVEMGFVSAIRALFRTLRLAELFPIPVNSVTESLMSISQKTAFSSDKVYHFIIIT